MSLTIPSPCRFIGTLLLVVPGALTAQGIRGVVRDSATGSPIPGVVITYTDSAGRVLARSLTSDRGDFATGVAGVRGLRAQKIGFRRTDLSIGKDATTISVSLAYLPSMLDPIQSVSSPRCPRRDD